MNLVGKLIPALFVPLAFAILFLPLSAKMVGKTIAPVSAGLSFIMVKDSRVDRSIDSTIAQL